MEDGKQHELHLKENLAATKAKPGFFNAQGSMPLRTKLRILNMKDSDRAAPNVRGSNRDS